MPSKTLILSSGKCAWGECIFCGYGRIMGFKPEAGALARKFNEFFGGLAGDVDGVKVFGSGSFLDEKQVPAGARKEFARLCKKHGICRVTVESRPEFVSKKTLDDFTRIEYTIALGLEVANNDRLSYIQKGFRVGDYEKAASLIHECDGKVRTYVLANLPGVVDVKEELDNTVKHALRFSDSVVVINLLPHGNTPLMRLWTRGEWNYLSKKEFRSLVAGWNDNPKVELDEETFRFVPRFPKQLQEKLSGVGETYLTHPHFEVWQDYLTRWYTPPKNRVLLFLPCSKTKPYSKSKTHQNIIGVLEEAGVRALAHEVMLSNAGVVPRELEDNYPFNAYDWDEKLETPEIKKRYIEVTAKRAADYLRAHKEYYLKVGCYLKHDSESYAALTEAAEDAGVECTNLLTRETYEKIRDERRPLQSDAAATDLKENIVEWLRRNSL